MKKNQNLQLGFTVVETLLVILIIAVIGFGGYYVGHSRSKDTKTATATPIVHTNAKPATAKIAPVADTAQYLKITPLSIELPVTSQISDLTYDNSYEPSGTVSLVSSSTLGALYHQINPNCVAEKYPVIPNLLSSTAPGVNQVAKASVAVNGTTYYLFSKGGSVPCDDPTDNYNPTWNPTQAQQAQIDAYTNAVYAAVKGAKAIQ